MATLGYKTLREQVVSAIREKILSHEFKPGERIKEQALSEEFGISRGPIREALRQLEQEGFIEYIRNAGCTVRTITLKDTYEICLLRVSYEMLSVRVIDGKFPEEIIEKMDMITRQMEMVDENSREKLGILNDRFHALIVGIVGLPRVVKAWEELGYGSILAHIENDEYREAFAEGFAKDHKVILEKIKAGEPEAICKEIYRHYMGPVCKMIEESGEETEGYFFPRGMVR